ncbi:hypothetical protein [Paenibacillus sp.]|uniref:hypothetical protein n=1 Tax=Paenibacillus sp. TaxID=58172 RepID=UPI002D549483|nr:hypothetical protein [Paenibacillus sp.]HZG84720.1 hypothetical protein [Paenibacillus sp.]
MKDCANPRCRCGDCSCGEGCRCDHRAYPYPTPYPVPYIPYYRDVPSPSAVGRFGAPPPAFGALPYAITP